MMPPFTPPFARERLVQARETAGMPVASLARLINVTRQTITNYESGRSQPKTEVVDRFAQVFRYPVEFFYSPPPPLTYAHGFVFFRDTTRHRKLDQEAAGRALELTQEYVHHLLAYVDLPEVRFVELDLPRSPQGITSQMILQAAESLRAAWDLGVNPIRNLVRIAELNGLIIRRCPIGGENLDALSMWSEELRRPIILLNDQKSSSVRSRFDLAHELAHMLLHRNIPADQRSEPSVHRKLERQAHAFASAFLLPATSWASEVNVASLATFQALKPKWLVSIAAQVVRAHSTGIVDNDEYQSLMRQIGTRRWRRAEPLDSTIPIEEPVLLRKATELVASSSPQGLLGIVRRLPLDPGTLSEIANVPKEFFDPTHHLVTAMLPGENRFSN